MGNTNRTLGGSKLDLANQAGVAPAGALSSHEASLWWFASLILIALAAGFAAVSWSQISSLSPKLEVLPVALVLLVGVFVAYVLLKSRRTAELRGLARGLERTLASADLENLFQLVRKSQQGYRDLIDTFEDVLLSISLQGEILAVNRSAADLLGHSFAELVGRPLEDLVEIAEGAGRAAAEAALPVFLEQRHWSGVLRVRLKSNGSTRFFQAALHALVRDGQVCGLSVMARDITQQRENETRFTELFETLQEGVYLATADGKLEDINPAMARMLGYDRREEILGCPLSKFLLDPEAWRIEQQELARTGALYGREIALRHRDGSLITCLHAAALIRDSAGRVRRNQGTLVDITERRAMEVRLHREQEFARRLVESFPDLVIAADREGRYSFVSPKSKELLGFAPEEMIGQPLGQRMDVHDRREAAALFDALVSGQCSEKSLEYWMERRDGEMRLFRATASPLLDASGKIEGIIASARDVTEAKRMEQQLIQSERLAAMGQMIAGVAHELNNPLTAVLGVTELLRDSATDEDSRRQLDLAHRQSRRAAQIVQNLLCFSRPPQPRKLCVHMDDLIQRSLQLHEHSLRTNRITVDFQHKPGLPAILGDTSQLTQVFLNLIANGEQAIREIRDHGKLRIRVARLGDRVLATFQDDGVGIRREILPKLFDPFFTTKRPGRGTGLGLSICLAILREHGGQIEAQPLTDGGSVFTVSLPVAQGTEMFLADSAPSASAAPPAPPSERHPERLSGCSVLVVDDEESILELVRDGLSVRGMHVDVATSGEEALSLAAQHSYDAILCDINLRGNDALSGRALHKRMMSEGAAAQKPVFLFMTGDLIDTAKAEGPLGAELHTLQKPFRISELIAVLTSALASAPAQSAESSTGGLQRGLIS